MTKLCKILLCVLCLTMTGVMNPAITFSQSAKESAGEGPAVQEASGEIVSVDAANQTVVVKVKQNEAGETFQEVKLLVGTNTMIDSESSSLTISDLKPGNRVTIVYETTANGINKANSIMVK